MRLLTAVLLAACLVGCNPRLTAPSGLVPPGTHQSPLVAVGGSGRGGVSVTPKSIPEGSMAVDISVLASDARPNTSYFVQRAPDVGRDLQSDGICQRSLGVTPWSVNDPPAARFLTFPLGSGVATLTTDRSGIGNVNFEFRSPTTPAGTTFDVMFRLVDSEAAPSSELRSGCLSVLVK
jgi:hypothetical protein